MQFQLHQIYVYIYIYINKTKRYRYPDTEVSITGYHDYKITNVNVINIFSFMLPTIWQTFYKLHGTKNKLNSKKYANNECFHFRINTLYIHDTVPLFQYNNSHQKSILAFFSRVKSYTWRFHPKNKRFL